MCIFHMLILCDSFEFGICFICLPVGFLLVFQTVTWLHYVGGNTLTWSVWSTQLRTTVQCSSWNVPRLGPAVSPLLCIGLCRHGLCWIRLLASLLQWEGCSEHCNKIGLYSVFPLFHIVTQLDSSNQYLDIDLLV